MLREVKEKSIWVGLILLCFNVEGPGRGKVEGEMMEGDGTHTKQESLPQGGHF